MPLRVPPPEIPVVTFLSPNKADQGLIEFWNTEIASYVALDIGAPHPNTRQYPNFTLGSQRPVQEMKNGTFAPGSRRRQVRIGLITR